ncbi:unnamed protein product [Closterium sp. Yama58-4]|nr:unnamed protein product [Closterium sp. Yama58-4]
MSKTRDAHITRLPLLSTLPHQALQAYCIPAMGAAALATPTAVVPATPLSIPLTLTPPNASPIPRPIDPPIPPPIDPPITPPISLPTPTPPPIVLRPTPLARCKGLPAGAPAAMPKPGDEIEGGDFWSGSFAQGMVEDEDDATSGCGTAAAAAGVLWLATLPPVPATLPALAHPQQPLTQPPSSPYSPLCQPQVLLNLVDNAFRRTSEGVVVVHVKEGAAAHLLRVEVQDSGEGLSEEERARMLEPVMDSSGVTEGEQTGLALYVVKLLVDLQVRCW